MKRLAALAATAALLAGLSASSASATSEADCASRPGGVMNHEIRLYFYGFHPPVLYVCPNDQIMFHNANTYDMQFTVDLSPVGMPPLNTGRIPKNTSIGPFIVTPYMNLNLINLKFSDYNVGGIKSGKLVMGVAPTEYAPNQRYKDPPN